MLMISKMINPVVIFLHGTFFCIFAFFQTAQLGGIVQIEEVTRRILWITSTNPAAKVFVFSKWMDVSSQFCLGMQSLLVRVEEYIAHTNRKYLLAMQATGVA